ncbi:hypothetical protein KSF_039000 [Reticulibacter mediterranei]|uniref:Lipoprotein n=1 Tax=Reticulibacter mediterranei TaxID=2778369 RepID=A0A8J3IME2_9CHLR|nr:hypothetical protein [Reticulibacter mediterranei]GHO93852.1 hypothetical protein KSF_039000 [Reticulibacter mediterranei]
MKTGVIGLVVVLWLLFLAGCTAFGSQQVASQSSSALLGGRVVEVMTIKGTLSSAQKSACYDLKSGNLIYRVVVDGHEEAWHTGGELPSVAETRFGDPQVGDCFLHEGKYYRVVEVVYLRSS